MEEIKIGSKFWMFDGNRRKYKKDHFGGPIYERHFFEVQVIGETSRSWIIGHIGYNQEIFKAPKSDPFKSKGSEFGLVKKIFTEKMKDDDIWVNSHKIEIIDRLRMTKDADLFKRIAKEIGYKY